MTIIVVANNKGGSRKTATALNLAHHFRADFCIDLDKYHALASILSQGKYDIPVYTPKTEESLSALIEDDSKRIVIDCGGFDSDLTRFAISQADHIVTPANDDPSEQLGLMDFNNTLQEVSKMVGEQLIATVVISGVHHNRRDFSAMGELVDSLSNVRLSPVIIPYTTKIPAAQYQGKPVTASNIAARFSRIVKNLEA